MVRVEVQDFLLADLPNVMLVGIWGIFCKEPLCAIMRFSSRKPRSTSSPRSLQREHGGYIYHYREPVKMILNIIKSQGPKLSLNPRIWLVEASEQSSEFLRPVLAAFSFNIAESYKPVGITSYRSYFSYRCYAGLPIHASYGPSFSAISLLAW
jgi:hypothetical protein